ncbi:MAG: porin [Thiobacillaceae bacterium]
MENNKRLKRTMIAIACTLGLAATEPVLAANWIMIQGTEDPAASARAYVWGFVQAQYQKDFSDANPGPAGCAAGVTNCYVPPKVLGPNLDSQSQFNINRARIGVRGTGFPIDSRINYFILTEFGNNDANKDNTATLMDASITASYIPGARVRAGLFKYPGAEEGLQGIAVYDYINFTEVSNALLLERFPNQRDLLASDVKPAQALPMSANSLNGFDKGNGAFRDAGVQVFDAFDVKNDWELSYAAMIGNGSGLSLSNSDGKYDTYLYLSAEKQMGGRGPKAEGLKFFAWSQQGKRLLDDTIDAKYDPKMHDRNRAGLGVKYFNKPFRVTAEYIDAKGMIWEGPDKPDFKFANVSGADAKANGWYVEGGYFIPKTKWELDARYDTVDLLKGTAAEHEFKKTTLGVQYHLNPKTRVTLDYEFRDFSCTAASTNCTAANKNLNGVGNKVGIQLTAIF